MKYIDPIDLVCKARRRLLSSEEQRTAAELLRQSSEARLAQAVLCGFEREGTARPGDDANAARLVTFAIEHQRYQSSRRRTWVALNAAAAILLVAGAAAAWRMIRQVPHAPPISSGPTNATHHQPIRSSAAVGASYPSSPTTVEPVAAAAGTGSPMAQISAPALASNADAAPASSATLTAPRYLSTTKAALAPVLSAGPRSDAVGIFAEANRLRREGREREAASLYRVLIDGFPTAREAPLARLALAKLISREQPGEALTQYRLVAARSGPLQAEALWGEADLAHRLGERTLEQQAAGELVRLYPDSPYAEVARERLDDGSP